MSKTIRKTVTTFLFVIALLLQTSCAVETQNQPKAAVDKKNGVSKSEEARSQMHDHHAGMDHSEHNMHGPVPASKRNLFAGKQHGVTKTSKKGIYEITLYSSKAPIPQRTIHDWILHIETRDGVIVEDAKVFIFGGMPMHQHGFPTKPRVKQYLGNGNYRVEGIKFNMPGHWEMRFNIKHKGKLDRVIYKIHLGR